ncbi:MAG: hypothetical protein IJE66_04945 [Akkermansia sp.]|nr:hypothetical protein [Akkermansia sp.]
MRIHYLLFAAALAFNSASWAQNTADTEEIADVTIDGAPDDIFVREENRREGEVPAMFRDDSLLDDSYTNRELGINVYTAPSISKIFAQLDDLPAIPEAYVLRKRPEKLPIDAGKLALEMGYLLADGFIAVRSGHMNDIKPIALDLTRYGKAIGVGDKMNVHSAALLEHAEKGQLEEFKRILSSTQSDVNDELTALRDPDLAHLLALGGWIRALDAAAAAIEARFDARQAAAIFYREAPEYFNEILAGLNPRTSNKLQVEQMRVLLEELTELMTPAPGEVPTMERVRAIHQTALRISTLAVGEGYEH